MTDKENDTIMTQCVHVRTHKHAPIWGSMGSQKGYSFQLGGKLLNYQNMWIKNLWFYGFKRDEEHLEQV